jgi:hypothetical protein
MLNVSMKNMQTVAEVCHRFYIFHSMHYRNTRNRKCKIRQCPTGKTTLSLNNIKERLCKTNVSVYYTTVYVDDEN